MPPLAPEPTEMPAPEPPLPLPPLAPAPPEPDSVPEAGPLAAPGSSSVAEQCSAERDAIEASSASRRA
jgi:hypothetical protein